jgi:hypothetical protein
LSRSGAWCVSTSPIFGSGSSRDAARTGHEADPRLGCV